MVLIEIHWVSSILGAGVLKLVGFKDLNATEHAEFDEWKWSDRKTAINSVIKFKKKVYESILQEFSNILEKG